MSYKDRFETLSFSELKSIVNVANDGCGEGVGYKFGAGRRGVGPVSDGHDLA